VRVIAATNVNLERGITEGKIREDLYYRLSQIPIQIPPLRDRKKDIKELCDHLIRKINADYGRNVEGITGRTLAYLQSYDWPGNVRELENVLGRAIIYMEMNEQLIDVEHIPTLERKKKVAPNDEKKVATDKSLAVLLEEHEKKILAQALAENKGSRTKTAKQLGISIRSFYYKLEKYQL
jgi:transcriptional regulator with PAS, ATPase and Fis domain